MKTIRRLVVFDSDCPRCPCCGEPWCKKHKMHYADCPCIGPSNAEEEGYGLLVDKKGKLWAIKP